ncbi:MAG: hypothetical protein E7J46_01970 [Streptococcus lutetiensis]|nr:hypothetical protein [Streptococcus lutetiensis]MDU7908438.1 hypothetical protein [Streptococcus lutetiensis]
MKIVEILNEKQIAFVKECLPNFDLDKILQNGALNDDFAEALEDYYQLKAFDNAYNITQKGKIAESIIDKFVDLNIW